MSRAVITSVRQLTLFGVPMPFAVVRSGGFRMADIKLKPGNKYSIEQGKLDPADRARVTAKLRS